ncbi:MAG: HNH endonuclease [Actinobacteria bacterium]|nr:HNH endonuclease [Actinomycetota bacterium]
MRSAIDELASVPDEELSDEELDANLGEVAHARDRLDVLQTRWMRLQSERRGHDRLGYSSPTAYLKDRGRMSAGHARRIVSMANVMVKASVVTRAWSDGRISTDQAGLLLSLVEVVPEEFAAAEEALVEIVEPLSVSDTGRALEYWRQSVDGPGELSEETQLARRGVSLSKTMGGMRRVDGWMTATAGHALETALETLMPPPGEDEERSPGQRRHDALEDLARSHLDHGDTPTVGGEKSHIMVLADPDALKGIAGGTHESLDGEVFDVETIRRLACDSSVSRIVFGPQSEILDVGRKTRVWSPAQRRAIIARDRHCVEPGCDRPPDWCDIHHKTHWADGGDTSVDSGELRCRYHHTKEHSRQARAHLRERRRT